MKLHLLLTSDIAKTKPDTCIVIAEFGSLEVVFDGYRKVGLHCIVEDLEENIIKWLGPFDGFVKGSGVPQFEQFTISHINKDGIKSTQSN